MATQEELYKLSLVIQGQEKAAELAKQVAACESLLKQLIAAQGGVGAASGQMSASLKHQATVLANLREQLRQTEAENRKLAGGWRANTQGIAQFAYAIDDAKQFGVSFSAGLRAISNNIQPVLAGFKATAALAGPIAILATVGGIVYDNWDTIAKLWREGETDKEAARMAELAKQTKKTADEAARLARYERNKGKVEEQDKAATPAQAAASKDVDKIVEEEGAGSLDKLLRTLPGLPLREALTTPDERARLERDAKYIDDTEGAAKRANKGLSSEDEAAVMLAKRRMKKLNEALDKRTDEYIKNARINLQDDPAEAHILADRLEAMGRKDLATKFRNVGLSREDIEARDKIVRDSEQEAFAKKDPSLAIRPANVTRKQIDAEKEAIDAERAEEWRMTWEQGHRYKLEEYAKNTEKANLDFDEEHAWQATQDSIDVMKAQRARRMATTRKIRDDILGGENAQKFILGTATDEDYRRELRRRGGEKGVDRVQLGDLKHITEVEMGRRAAGVATERGTDTFGGRLWLAEQARKKAAARAEEETPGLRGSLSNMIQGNVAAGGTIAGAQNALFRWLARTRGGDAARGLLEGAGKEAFAGLAEKMAERAFRPLGVNVLQGNATLRDSIQAATSRDDTQKELLTASQKSAYYLEIISRREGLR